MQKQHHGHGVDWRRLKTIVHVKLARRFVESMHEQGANSSILRNSERASHRILQHSRTELMSLEALIDRQTSKYHHRNQVRHIPADAPGGFLMSNSASCHRVIRDDVIRVIRDDKGAACPSCLIGQGASPQPFIKQRFSTGKAIEPVLGR